MNPLVGNDSPGFGNECLDEVLLPLKVGINVYPWKEGADKEEIIALCQQAEQEDDSSEDTTAKLEEFLRPEILQVL